MPSYLDTSFGPVYIIPLSLGVHVRQTVVQGTPSSSAWHYSHRTN